MAGARVLDEDRLRLARGSPPKPELTRRSADEALTRDCLEAAGHVEPDVLDAVVGVSQDDARVLDRERVLGDAGQRLAGLFRRQGARALLQQPANRGSGLQMRGAHLDFPRPLDDPAQPFAGGLGEDTELVLRKPPRPRASPG